jgi:N-acyl-D-amino-acid deacylase
MLDVIIRNGMVYDGLGGEPYRADIGIKDGLIAVIGEVAEPAVEIIDAAGLMVTPGFVDVHTHYDGQVIWESRLLPSSAHGVTTVVMGNCGVGFAPCRTQDHDALIALMAGVEDIPEVVMAEGLAWNWETFPEYLDAIESRPHDINIAALIPHSALRVYVMGERAINREPATPEDIKKMAALSEEAMEAGAIGFGTSRAVQHKSVSGEPIPTVRANEDELAAIVEKVHGRGGYFQVLSDFDEFQDMEGEFNMLTRVSSSGTMSFTLQQKHSAPDDWRTILNLAEAANDAGLTVKPLVLPRPTGVLLSHELTATPLDSSPTYQTLKAGSFEALIEALKDVDTKAKIISELSDNPIIKLSHVFELGAEVNYEPEQELNVVSKAESLGRDPADYVYDLMLQDGGRRVLFSPFQNYADFSLNPSYEMLTHRDTIVGLGDGGAHLGLICDASYPTTLLSYWSRDRVRGPTLALTDAIKKMTSETAELAGLHDRGRLAVGYRADINIIDHANLMMELPTPIFDLPAGGRRIVQGAQGYVATLVSGVVTQRAGVSTGALPGCLIRGVQSAPALQ